MNIRAKQTKITAKHRSRYIYLDGVILYHKINGLPHLLKRENHAYSLNPLTPVDILETKWEKWNENDEIIYKSVSGTLYLISEENLLADISEFMKQNKLKGSLPYLHIEGRDRWDCYRRPAKNHILEFLRTHLSNYDIYSINGDLLQESNDERRKFTLCVDLD